MTNPKYEAPEFLEVTSASGATFIPFQEAIADPAIIARVVASALNDADKWFRRYAAFFDRIGGHEGLEIVEAIERAKRNLGNSWPDVQMFDIRRDPIHTSARAGRFRPPT
ncbi:MAG: hypothetical protein O3B95_13380, partial [Chloroflexi bacterium]|nr:hypothetical protein [Chloroflexota bacterium]